MRVCMIYYTFSGNPTLLREAEALTDQNHQVDILCLGKTTLGKKTIAKNLNVYKIQKRRYNEGGRLRYLYRHVRFFIIASLVASYYHLKNRYDVVHVTSPPDVMVFASLGPKLLGAKVILDIHDMTPEFYAEKFCCAPDHWIVKTLKLLEKFSAKYADHVITVTHIWKETLVSRSVEASKCSVLMNVPDPKIYSNSTSSIPKNSNCFTILYPGNVDFGVDTLVKAMPIISREIPSARLEIYGDGTLFSHLVKLAKDTGVAHVVNFTKTVPRDQLAKVMCNADIGVDPMKDGDFFGEVLTVKSLEFLTMGVPLVVSKTKATQYYYNDKIVSFFEASNHEDLARTVINLYRNPKRRQELIQNSKEFNSIYNWDYYKNVYIDLVTALSNNS